MLIANVENPNKKHYVAVKSLSRLLSKQNSKHKEAQHFCTNCLNGFESEIIRDKHYEYCRSKDSVRVEMQRIQQLNMQMDSISLKFHL